jgi:hypothetical protein
MWLRAIHTLFLRLQRPSLIADGPSSHAHAQELPWRPPRPSFSKTLLKKGISWNYFLEKTLTAVATVALTHIVLDDFGPVKSGVQQAICNCVGLFRTKSLQKDFLLEIFSHIPISIQYIEI